MPIHARVLDAALRICRGRRGWTFRPAEIVASLPELNASSVRTHVMSRCCVNAPPHHPHRWPYFRRVERGVYQVLPPLRKRRSEASPVAGPTAGLAPGAARTPRAVQEMGRRTPVAPPGPDHMRAGRALLSVEVRERGGRYVAASAEFAPGIEGTSLESVVSRVVSLARERLRKAGGPPVRLSAELRFEAGPGLEPSDPLVAAYAKDIDRTLIRENLRLSVEERLEKLQGWAEAMDEIRGAAWRSRRGAGKT